MLAALSLMVGGLSTAACSSSTEDVRAPAEDTGTLTAALSAVGPDGATYTMSGAALVLSWTGSAGSGNNVLLFNSTTPTQSFSVAPGTYTAKLQAPATLNRMAASGPTSVPAKLADAQPYTFTVSSHQTTNLTFHFLIEGFGTVTFSTGTLNTSLQVDAGTTLPSQAQVAGTANVAALLNGPAGLNMALTTSAASLAASFNISASLTSAFEPSAESACANITATMSATSGASAAEQNFAALFNETSGGTGTVCFYDQTAPQFAGQMVLTFFRVGLPQTPQITAALGSSATSSEGFGIAMNAQPAMPVYDGSSLNLATFDQPVSMTIQGLNVNYNPTETALVLLIGSTPQTVTVTLTP
jgi:hypothetical protein